MGKKLGMACKLYYSDALLDGDTVTPQNATWAELGNVSDSTLNRARGEADVTGRSNNGRKATLTTLLDESVDFDIWSDSDDEGLEAVETAFNDNALLAMAVMDGDIATAGSRGLVANFSITKCNRSEPLEGGVKLSITIKPGDEQTAWYKPTGA